VIVSTGAAPGYFAIVLGRLFGARTIWIDSMANIENLSDVRRARRPVRGPVAHAMAALAKSEGPITQEVSCDFATVGSQEPFDRLIRAVDEWAVLHGRSDVFAQIGDSTYCPEHIKIHKVS